MRGALRELIGEAGEKRVKIGLAKDGSGVGGKCPCCNKQDCIRETLRLMEIIDFDPVEQLHWERFKLLNSSLAVTVSSKYLSLSVSIRMSQCY